MHVLWCVKLMSTLFLMKFCTGANVARMWCFSYSVLLLDTAVFINLATANQNLSKAKVNGFIQEVNISFQKRTSMPN